MDETKVIERPNSYEISVNAKGQWSGKIKVYADTIEEAKDKAYDEAVKLHAHIREKNGV